MTFFDIYLKKYAITLFRIKIPQPNILVKLAKCKLNGSTYCDFVSSDVIRHNILFRELNPVVLYKIIHNCNKKNVNNVP